MSPEEKKVFACGDKFFCSLFASLGAETAEWRGSAEEALKAIEESSGAFFIFSQGAFDGLREDFKKRFAAKPYIVFPLPGEENKIEKEISELVKIAVGVDIDNGEEQHE